MHEEIEPGQGDGGNGRHHDEERGAPALGEFPVDRYEPFGGELNPHGNRLFHGTDDPTQPLSGDAPELQRQENADRESRLGHLILWLHERYDDIVRWSQQRDG